VQRTWRESRTKVARMHLCTESPNTYPVCEHNWRVVALDRGRGALQGRARGCRSEQGDSWAAICAEVVVRRHVTRVSRRCVFQCGQRLRQRHARLWATQESDTWC
jgi:hypothetical protein